MNLDPAPEVGNFEAAPPLWLLAGDGSTDLDDQRKKIDELKKNNQMYFRYL